MNSNPQQQPLRGPLGNLFIIVSTIIFSYLQGETTKELAKSRLESENLKRQMLQQEITFNIQRTEALTRLERDMDEFQRIRID